jgi:GT2 family glycosyltransferase
LGRRQGVCDGFRIESKVTAGRGLARLQGAVSRHGLPALAGLVWRTVRKLGWSGALGLARQDRPFLSVDLDPEPSARPRAVWPPVLDANRTLPAEAWRRWLDRRLAHLGTSSSPSVVVLREGEDASALAPDTLCVLLKAGDQPRPELLAALAASPAEVQVVTFDLFRRAGADIAPLLLPGADPLLLSQHDYLFSRGAVRAGLIQGGVRESILGWCAGRSLAEVRAGWRHIGLPLVEAAIPDEGRVTPAAPARRPSTSRMDPVSVVLCTRDKGHLTRQLVRRLLADDGVGEIVIVSNGTANPHALQTLADLAAEPRVTVLKRDEPFNFSRLCNAGVRETRLSGPLLFINDDVTPVAEDWLSALASRLDDPDTGAVGPLLLYPDERVQHAGMYLRQQGGAGHLLRFARLPQDDYLGLAASAREVTAVTGAVLLTRRADFEAVGGFDEALAISLQDVDCCLKLRRLGRRNVFEPRAVLLHMESTSLQGVLATPAVARQRHADHQLFMGRWGDQVAAEPFHPAGFDPEDETLHRLVKP